MQEGEGMVTKTGLPKKCSSNDTIFTTVFSMVLDLISYGSQTLVHCKKIDIQIRVNGLCVEE